MIIGRRRFDPSWWAVALTAAGVALFVVLGMWQLQRAALKESIETKFEQRLAQPYRPLQAMDDQADIEFRRVLLEGKYDTTRNLLVDNQLRRGRAGYHVLTPFQLRDSAQVVLVNRGWAPWGESRATPAPIASPE